MSVSLKGFEENLQNLHMEDNPFVLDDNLPDSFDAWISELSYLSITEMAKTYCYFNGEKDLWKEIAEEYWTQNFGALPTENQLAI
jgi:hypothetical protein